jgi:hypothetical protein
VLRNAAQRLAGGAARLQREIAERHDADQALVAIEHPQREPAAAFPSSTLDDAPCVMWFASSTLAAQNQGPVKQGESDAAGAILARGDAWLGLLASPANPQLPEGAALGTQGDHPTITLPEPSSHWVYILEPVFPYLLSSKVWILDAAVHRRPLSSLLQHGPGLR